MIDALDSFVSTSVRHGENGNSEFDWSNDLQEKIVQFDFQCVRTDESGVASLSAILDGLLSQLSIKQNSPEKELLRKELLITLYKMIGKTRDLEGGKGEYTIAYMMIHVWYKYYPKLSAVALSLFVFPPSRLTLLFPLDVIGTTELNDQIPYGSWKDIKYFCDYIKKQESVDHPLIQTCVIFINTQIHLDEESLNSEKNISLVGKWVPRESSEKFGWMFEHLATNYFTKFMESAKTPESKIKALKKCKVQYRILCSKLNKHLDTVQIKQCSKVWSTIEHAKTTSITMAKQRKAFLNQKKTGSDPRTDDHDRVLCAENLRSYLESLKKEGKEVKGKNVGLETFAAQALGMLDYSYELASNRREDANILNSQWRDNGNKKNTEEFPTISTEANCSMMSGYDPTVLNLFCEQGIHALKGLTPYNMLMKQLDNPRYAPLETIIRASF